MATTPGPKRATRAASLPPAPELYVLSDFDSDDDVNPAAMRLALEALETGRKRGKGEVITPAKKRLP